MSPHTLGWLDCSSGASGDMLLGALVGAGVPNQVIADAVAALGLPVSVDVRPTTVASLAAHRAEVTTDQVHAPTRALTDIVALLEAATLDAEVRALAVRVFERLARAEALVHGSTVEAVHFHEVGALDAMADIVGCAAGFVHLGLEEVVVSPVALGTGRARTAHGELPVPVPAVLELMREAGLLTAEATAAHEQCTPTGAALLAAVATASGPMPAMVVGQVGLGAGTRQVPGVPNVVRLVLGTPPGAGQTGPERAVVLSTNVDDLDPRVWPAVLAELIEAGASDAWLTPILMKKGRPAHTLSVLCLPDLAPALRAIVFRETSALGLREQVVDKHALERSERSVELDGGAVRVKLGWLEGVVVNAQPEYDDVAAAARRSGRPIKVVLAEASAAARTVQGAG